MLMSIYKFTVADPMPGFIYVGRIDDKRVSFAVV